MEIISCVGARAARPRSLSYNSIQPLIKKIQNFNPQLRIFKNRINAGSSLLKSDRIFHPHAIFSNEKRSFTGTSRASASGIISMKMRVSFKDVLISTADFIDFLSKNIWLCVLALLSFAVPLTLNSFYNWNSGFAGTVRLEEIPSTELEILNKAMADFALDVSNDYDENGNLLNADGKVISGITADFRQKVTFTDYKVQSGDTISGISKKFGLSNISTLIAVNNISNVRQIRSGQKLKIPSTDGLIYTVKSGDSLNALSVKYQITVEDLLDVNDLETQVLTAGQKLFIPGAKLSGETLRMAMGELFIYPLSGKWRLTSPYGRRSDPFTGVKSFHTGIDMAMPSGTPIKASMSGKILTVGFTNVFGNYVIIKHINGYQTMYAHMSKVLVKSGQSVDQGEKIGLVGSTGYSTGPHLHFMVFKNGSHIDPMTVLKH